MNFSSQNYESATEVIDSVLSNYDKRLRPHYGGRMILRRLCKQIQCIPSGKTIWLGRLICSLLKYLFKAWDPYESLNK